MRQEPGARVGSEPSIQRRLSHDLKNSSISGDVVTVLVGSERKKFVIHEQPLRSSSRFFEAALSRGWKENTEKKVSLSEETPDLFEIYALWTYTRKLFTEDKTQAMESNQYPYARLAGLYNIGARLQDQQFQDATVDAILSETKVQRGGQSYLPSHEVIPIIYENTLPGDCARRLIVDICVRNRFTNQIKTDRGEAYLQFAADVALVSLSDSYRRSEVRTIEEDGGTCKYHHHGEKEDCYSKKLKDGMHWS